MGIKLKKHHISSFQFEEPQVQMNANQIEINEEVNANTVYHNNGKIYRIIMTVSLTCTFGEQNEPNLLLKTIHEYESEELMTKGELTPYALEAINRSRHIFSSLTDVLFPSPIKLPPLDELK